MTLTILGVQYQGVKEMKDLFGGQEVKVFGMPLEVLILNCLTFVFQPVQEHISGIQVS